MASNMTLAVPEPLQKRMQRHPELRWSEIARNAFEKKLNEIDLLEKFLSKSELSEEDAESIGHKIKHEIRKRF